jgi:AAHS family 3-hydroxyphenylpropionic acid transporter
MVPSAAASAATRGARLCLVLCALSALLEGFDNQAMGVAAPGLALEFGLSAAQRGFLFSATTFGLFVGAALGGRAADIAGRRRTLAWSMLLFGGGSLLTTLAGGFDWLCVARLATGLGLGGALPNYIALSREAAGPSHRLRSVTMVMAAMPLGGAISAVIALGNPLFAGWRPIFYVGGTAPIVLAIVILRLLPEPGARRDLHQPVERVGAILFGGGRCLTTLLLWCGFFFTQLVLLLMLNWLPSLIVGLGYSPAEAPWASVCFNLCGATGAVALSTLHAGDAKRAWVIVTYAGIAAALATLPHLAGAFALTIIACGAAGAFTVGAQLVLFALAPEYYRQPIRGTGVGAAVAVGRLGSVVGPLYAGALLTAGGGSAAVLTGTLPFVTIAAAAALALTWRPMSVD